MLAFKVATDVSGIEALVTEAQARGITLKGVRAAARILVAAAKAEAPRASGALRLAQGFVARKGRKGKTISFVVQGSRKKVVKWVTRKGRKRPTKAVPAFYDHLVNDGTRAHAVGKGSKLGRKGKAGGPQRGTRHLGAQGNPFRKRAWAAVRDAAGAATLAAMSDEVGRLIVKVSVAVQGKLGGR